MKHISLSLSILSAALLMGEMAHGAEVQANLIPQASLQLPLEIKGSYGSYSRLSGAKAPDGYDQKGSDMQISTSPSAKAHKIPPLLEVKGGYFFFSDAKMRKIYDHGGWDVQISGSYPVWKWLQIYGSVEYLERYGRSLGGQQRTNIWEIPLSLGLKPVVAICDKVHYYFTLGPRYFFVHQHNHSAYVDRSVSKNGLGGFVNTGFNLFPCPHFVIDVFGEYSYKRIHVHASKHRVYDRTIQVGGVTFGAGLGYAF